MKSFLIILSISASLSLSPTLCYSQDDSQQLKNKIQQIGNETVQAYLVGDLVWEIGTYSVTLSLPGMSQPVTDIGKYLTIWQKQNDGTFKIKLEIWNTDINPWQRSESQKL